MASADMDRYEAYYADKLWGLLPEIYRALDSDVSGQKGPLREIVDRIGVQAAILRRSIDRAWEDQSIESCDDWVIPYIADLLATRLVSSLDARGKRLDVAKTVYYRRRKGTLAVLEELSTDITGWDARVVEFFRRVARARHGLDLEIGWPAPEGDSQVLAAERATRIWGPLTRTPAHGIADLRSPHVARTVGTAFDELSYTPDVRAGRGRSGWYGFHRLGVFLYRLRSFAVERVTPVGDTATPCSKRFSFDPTGRRIPLFAASTRAHGDEWVSPAEQDLPGPISRQLFALAKADLYASSLGLQLEGSATVPEGQITGDPEMNEDLTYIDPEEGLLYLPTQSTVPSGGPIVSYHYGFSSEIGAGPYDRRTLGEPGKFVGTAVSGGSDHLKTALTALTAAGGSGVLILEDSLTYTDALDTEVTALTLRADNHRRPLVRLPDGGQTATLWTFTGTSEAAQLVIDGLFVSGGEVRLLGDFDSVTIVSSTLDPGTAGESAGSYASAIDGRSLAPCRLRIGAKVKRLVIDRSITGPIWVEGEGAVESIRITDSIVQALGTDLALDARLEGLVEIERSTILGPMSVHRLVASSSLLYGAVETADAQHSCVRFSAWLSTLSLPSFKPFESPWIWPGAAIFTSQVFGHPAYAQLSLSAPVQYTTGAEDGSEMGAFSREKNAIKESSLRVKLDEYMPVGTTPVFIYVT